MVLDWLLVRDLVMVLDWLLVTHLLNMLFALGPTRMMKSTSSFTLVMNVSTVTMTNFVSNDCCVMTHNVGCVVNILMLIMTVFGDNVFTLLNDGRGNNHFMFFMTNLLMVTFFF